MTNNEIILKTRIQLMNNGTIGTTGRKIEVLNENNEPVIIDEPAEIYTYIGWKRIGYQVPQGTKSRVFIPIWSRTETGGWIQRNAPFFLPDQVVPIEETDEVTDNSNAKMVTA